MMEQYVTCLDPWKIRECYKFLESLVDIDFILKNEQNPSKR